MPIRIRKISIRLLAAIVTFCLGIVATMLWVVPRLPVRKAPLESSVSTLAKQDEIAVPDNWQTLEFNERIVLRLPPEMKRAEIMGDPARYARAYSNRDLYLTLVGEVTIPELESKLREKKFYSCDRPEVVHKHPTYRESLVVIDGRQARLGIARGKDLGGISVSLCFPGPDDSAYELWLGALCNDESALTTVQQIFSSIRFKK